MKAPNYLLIFILFIAQIPSIYSQNIDSLKNVLATAPDNEKAELWIQLLNKNYTSGGYLEGLTLCEQAVKEISRLDDLPQLAMAYRWQSVYHTVNYHHDQAREASRKAERYMNLLSPEQKGEVYQAKSFLYLDLNTKQFNKDFDDSCRLYNKKAIEQFQIAEDTVKVLLNMFILISNYQNHDRNEQAMKVAKEYFAIADQLGDGLSIHNGNLLIAKIQMDLGQYEKSISRLKEAVKTADEFDYHVGDTYTSLINVYYDAGKYEEGLTFLKEIEQKGIFDKFSYDQKGRFLEVKALFNWGNPELVLKHLLELEDFHLENNRKDLADKLSGQIGLQCVELNEFDKGVRYLEKHLKTIDPDDYNSLSYYQQIITYGYLKLGNYAEAESAFVNYIKSNQADKLVKDSTSSAIIQQRTDQLYVEFETEKKEAEIVLLKEQEERKDAQLAESRAQVTALVVGVLALIVLAFVFLRGRNKLAIANREISRQNAEIQAANQEIRQQNEQLKISNEQLTLLHEEKDNLMQIVAHDLKSPLDNITSLSYLSMQPDVANDDRENYQEMVRKEHSRGKELIKDLLEVHGVERGMIKPNYTKASITHVIAEVINSFDEQARSKDITVHFDREGMPVIPTDQKWLSQIMTNLLSNAIKFSPHQKTIRVKVADKATDVYISVEDEGPGFTAEDQQKVFRKFQRLSARPTGGEGSTGLGLSIVKSYVEKLGGKINLESQLDKGSRFLIILSKAIQPSY